MQITLPISGMVVEIRESITYEEFQEIENFYQNRIKLDVDVASGEQNAIIDGALIQQMEDRMIQIYLKSCRGKDNEEISIVGLLKKLDAEDGILLKNNIGEKHDNLKKKLEPTKKK